MKGGSKRLCLTARVKTACDVTAGGNAIVGQEGADVKFELDVSVPSRHASGLFLQAKGMD